MKPTLVRIISIMTLLISSCTSSVINQETLSTPSPPSTTPQESKSVNVPIVPSIASDKVLEVCPDKISLSEQFPLDEKLLTWNYPSNHVFSFPELMESEFNSTSSLSISISPNGQYLATVNEHFDQQANIVTQFLEIINSNDQIILSIPWNENWTAPPTWITNEELFFRTSQEKVLTVFNPFLDASNNKVFNLPREENMLIVTVASSFKVVAYAYSSYKNTSNYGLNSLRVWNEEKQSEILDLKDEFSTLVSDVELSNNGKFLAITTVTPNEDQDHSEIIVVNVKNGTSTQISNFRKLFKEILVSDIQWSLDDKTMYLWASINGGIFKLYSLDIQTQQVTSFCFQGLTGFGNQIVWIPNAPEFYFVTDTTNFAHSADTDEWDILLVDSINNKSYKITENASMIGWLTPKK